VGFGLDFASCGILHCTPSDAALLLQEFFFALKVASFVISTLLCLGGQAYGDMQMMSSAGSRPCSVIVGATKLIKWTMILTLLSSGKIWIPCLEDWGILVKRSRNWHASTRLASEGSSCLLVGEDYARYMSKLPNRLTSTRDKGLSTKCFICAILELCSQVLYQTASLYTYSMSRLLARPHWQSQYPRDNRKNPDTDQPLSPKGSAWPVPRRACMEGPGRFAHGTTARDTNRF
jgi:hypothetical protein